ncbi:serine/threonine-protein kinase [Sphingosinicella sp. LHD-64]|uniref:serine/threonine-protein kinase n=1 Tax=Sphingosinicella sp. LHD-64 TaxID=3072139 RepID=UPI00280C54DC|nr:serine/threonine-protein kinase [Sphingosinicella sp. LHD-64]MDQ8757652.1 serine/threonine-protein kinase [Sphingosinicella sp. LHD-64]
MSDDKDKQPPENGEERTVFMPSGGTTPPAQPAAPVEPAAEPAAAPASEAPAEPVAAPPAPAPAPSTSAGVSPTNFAPREDTKAIQVGDVLNHIFEVKRFLARGGMGEVFEGVNVNTDERVAIKVMLPQMAADEKVVAMFRKEARTLTKLQHEALVSYRVLAQEPQLGVLYIVTEFIEGTELADVLGKVERSPDELAGLLRRLASGLGAAHKLGAIHRDMSPDNVLLPGGDVHQAKIIDFGIAKDLDASSATIVGDGFAGKLNYVAPEQLGDYGREIGPWTDVYSLALVILAVAQGKNVNMSGSLVDAIDKRRKGPDLAAVPASLKPVIEAMLRPDPNERLRSMEDVVAMLSGGAGATPAPPPPPPTGPTTAAGTSTPSGGGASKGLLVGGLLAAALAAGAAAWYLMPPPGPGPVPEPPKNEVVVDPGDPVATARSAVNSVLPSVSCTWLDIANVDRQGEGVRVAMRGVAGDGGAAQREINQALTAAGVQNATVDFGDVAPITQAGCAALDTYRQVRASDNYKLSATQPRYEMVMQPPGTAYAGEEAATAVLNFNFGDPTLDFAILGIEPSGIIQTIVPNRGNFEAALASSQGGRPIANEGNDRYRLSIDLDHLGWSGIILVTGRAPFDVPIVAPPVGSRGPSWQQQFLSAAAERGWRVEMVWFESVNRNSGDGPPPGSPAPPTGGDTPPADGGKPPVG